jgi:hypothetical protein
MKKYFISSDVNIRVELPEGSLTPIIGQEKLLIVGNELRIYHYLAGKPDQLLAKWMVTDNGKVITAREWVDKFEVFIAGIIWNEEARIQENSIEMIKIEEFAELPF